MTTQSDRVADKAVALVSEWLRLADQAETASMRSTMEQLEGVVTDDAGVRFVMQFVDRVVRPDDDGVAAAQLAHVVAERELPSFLSPVDKVLLQAGARLAPKIPKLVVPLARRRMRMIVGHLVAPAEKVKLRRHLEATRADGYALNVNLLGEAVLGEREANRRLQDLLAVLEQPNVDYVSVKISAVASQLNLWAHDDSLRRVSERLRTLFDRAATVSPPTFVNLDMEEFHDLELTLQAFMAVLDEDGRQEYNAGIVLQAYLPDSWPALHRLVAWANERHSRGGGEIKIRLVKGANLAMERVDAAMHGWRQAPYESKIESDANYKRCLDWVLRADRLDGVRIGIASHNLFDVAYASVLADERGVSDRIQFEMLQGMAPAHAQVVRDATDAESHDRLLLYTPAVRSEDFDVAISYLFRRLEENAAEENFLRALFTLDPGSETFAEQKQIFRESLEFSGSVGGESHRDQDRRLAPSAPYLIGEAFRNEPETDPTTPANQVWIDEVMSMSPSPVKSAVVDDEDQLDAILVGVRTAQQGWAETPGAERQRVLHAVAMELAARRGELISTMIHEANKTFAEADVEVAEAIDFARWYGDRAAELDDVAGAEFEPFGAVGVVPPWNFPVAIPAGGVLAALAAGNSVIFKPAPEVPRCAELVAEACWAAGVPDDVLMYVRVPENEIGQRLITSVDAVILTGASETADLFRSWKPDIRLFAETSGKNALIITPSADIDLAVADLARSAFGHSGQKCSAASLAILVGDVYDSPRFRRQLVDAVESLDIGSTTHIETNMGPLIGEANERLHRGLTSLEDGERWLVQPRRLDSADHLWSPGVRDGVKSGSWYHSTECFGPVLGLMHAETLDEAIAIQNSSAYGLTGGIHSLDPGEVQQWVDNVEVGNAYVNRAITGAIVQRQPFGGWKRSSVGPGAKAGGPNYVAQLGTWRALDTRIDDFEEVWAEHFSMEHDPTALFCESNVFRYRRPVGVLLRVGATADMIDVELARKAARVCGVRLVESHEADDSDPELAERLGEMGLDRIRSIGAPIGEELRTAANSLNIHIADQPVLAIGRIELQHYLREQAVSRTLHRFGNLVSST